MTDITYRQDGYWVRLYAENNHGENVIRQMLEQQQQAGIEPAPSVFVAHWPTVKAAICKAGYSVRKAKKVKLTEKELDDMYAELQELEI